MGHFKKGPVELCYYSAPSVGGALQYRTTGFCGEPGSRHRLYIAFGYFCLTVKLPFKSGNTYHGRTPTYGLGYHDDTLWLHFGEKLKCINMPWALVWYRRSLLLKNGMWEHEYRHEKRDKQLWNTDRWKDKQYTETHPYTYVREHGQVQNATVTCTVSEMEWRRAWLPFTKAFAFVRRKVEIDSDTPLGERVDTWKGGITGFSQDINAREIVIADKTIPFALSKAQATRKF